MFDLHPLLTLIEKLRGPGGCAWDQKQTLSDMPQLLLEETHEVIEAILDQNQDHIKEELGDLLFVILLCCDVAKKECTFSPQDIVSSIVEKMIRRHPHIFHPDTPHMSWHDIKKKEKSFAGRESILDGIPKSLPALSYAEKQGRKAARVGFDWPNVEGVIEKIEEELQELKEAIHKQNPAEIEHELGDLLMSCTNLSRKMGMSSESALRKANLRFAKRFQWMEQNTVEPLDALFTEALEELWKAAKKTERDTDT